jgi:hypothetical protein
MKIIMVWIIIFQGGEWMICLFVCLLDVLCKCYYVINITTLAIQLSSSDRFMKILWYFIFLNCVRIGYNHGVKHGDNIYDIFLSLSTHLMSKMQYVICNVFNYNGIITFFVKFFKILFAFFIIHMYDLFIF